MSNMADNEKIKSIFVYASDYDEYKDNKDNIDAESVVFIEEKGKEKIITQNKEFNFIPSDGKNGQVLQYDSENGVKWVEMVNDNAFELIKFKEGYGTKSTQNNCNVGANGSFAVGNNTKASGRGSYAEGNSTSSSGEGSHAEGGVTEASGGYSHAEGWNTTASGYNSHAEGDGTKASNHYSHAEGYYTEASGEYSHAEGGSTKSIGNGSHAEGSYTVANGYYSHAEGSSTNTNNYSEHAQGRYNVSNKLTDDFGSPGNTHSSIGIGINNLRPKNAQEVMQNGDFYVIGIGGYDGTNIDSAKTVQEVVNENPVPTGNYIQEIKQNGGYITYKSTNFRTGGTDEKTINFKTINGEPVFGAGDIKVSGGGAEFPDGVEGQVLTKTKTGVEFQNPNGGIILLRITRDEYNSKFDAGTLDDNTLYLITG